MKRLLFACALLSSLLGLAPAWGQSVTPSTIPNVTVATGNLPPANGGTGLTVPFSTVLRGYMAGCVTSNDGTSPNTVIDIALCNATDDTYTNWLQEIAFLKNMNAAWAAGNGSTTGCLDGHGAVTTLQASTAYWIYAIGGSGQSNDYLCSSQAFGTVDYPTGYSYKRAIGWVLTDVSSHITQFSQNDDTWYWGNAATSAGPFKDVNLTNAATSAQLIALTVPAGISVRPIITCAATGAPWWVTSPTGADLAPNATFGTSPGFDQGTSTIAFTFTTLYTNTSSQLRFHPNAATNTEICYTWGWQWSRGRLS